MKTLTIHDLLKPVKKRPIPSHPRRMETPQEMVRLQIEVPYRVFEHFRGKDGRGWQKRIARYLERATED